MPARRKHIPKETLQHLYLEQGLSPRKIGQQLGCGETAVRKRLKEYNIPTRSRSQAIRLGTVGLPQFLYLVTFPNPQVPFPFLFEEAFRLDATGLGRDGGDGQAKTSQYDGERESSEHDDVKPPLPHTRELHFLIKPTSSIR